MTFPGTKVNFTARSSKMLSTTLLKRNWDWSTIQTDDITVIQRWWHYPHLKEYSKNQSAKNNVKWILTWKHLDGIYSDPDSCGSGSRVHLHGGVGINIQRLRLQWHIILFFHFLSPVRQCFFFLFINVSVHRIRILPHSQPHARPEDF